MAGRFDNDALLGTELPRAPGNCDLKAYKYYTPPGRRPVCREYSSGGNCRGAQLINGPTRDARTIRYGELAFIPPCLDGLSTVWVENNTGEILTMEYRSRNERSKPLLQPGRNKVVIPYFSPPDLARFRTVEAYPLWKGGLNYNTQMKKPYESAWNTMASGSTYTLSLYEDRILVNDVWR